MSEKGRTSGWVTTSVGEIATLVRGITYNKEQASKSSSPDLKPVLRANNINGTLNFDDLVFVPQHLIRSEQIIKTGDIIFAMSSGSKHLVGKSARARFDFDGSYGAFCGLLRAHEQVDENFLYYVFQNNKFRRLISEVAKGSNINNLKREHILDFEIALPPLPEQHRIVAKIEELFSELDKGIENLKIARAQLKVYRQALLKHAFEGKLTAQWRAERSVTPAKAGVQPLNDMDSRLRGNDEVGSGNDKPLETADALLKRIQQERAQRYQQQLADWQTNGGSKPKAPKILPPLTAEELAELPKLPEGWRWTRLIEACESVVDCHNKTAPYQASGIPLIRTPSIRDMKLNFDDSIRFVSEKTYEFWSKRCPPQPGDILFTREAPMGEAAIIPERKTVCMGQRIMLLRPGTLLSAKYLLSATQAHFFKKVAGKVAVGTGVKHLRVGDVERLTFPICSTEEQLEIANQLDARLSEVDQLEQTITTSLQQAEALRQSILKKAFSGKLVPQDPHDEPASVLLARIRAERATAKESLVVRPRGKRG